MKVVNNLAIGVDIENIDRFRHLKLKKDSLFLKKIYTKTELSYCFSKKPAAPHLAVRYAAKEAIVKALSSIGYLNLDYQNIEIIHSKIDVPMVNIRNGQLKNLKIKISLSHSNDKAIAFVLVFHDET